MLEGDEGKISTFDMSVTGGVKESITRDVNCLCLLSSPLLGFHVDQVSD